MALAKFSRTFRENLSPPILFLLTSLFPFFLFSLYFLLSFSATEQFLLPPFVKIYLPNTNIQLCLFLSSLRSTETLKKSNLLQLHQNHSKYFKPIRSGFLRAQKGEDALLPIKEHQIVDQLCPGLKDEVMKIMPVQKQTRAGQRTCFKAFVVVGDNNGHVGLGVKCSKEVATAIRGAIILAKLSVNL